jgi:hypothetical protein
MNHGSCLKYSTVGLLRKRKRKTQRETHQVSAIAKASMGKTQLKNQKVREPQSRHSSRGAQTLKREVRAGRKYNDLHNSTRGRWSLATVLTSGARLST